MMAQALTALPPFVLLPADWRDGLAPWMVVKDGNEWARQLYERHYTADLGRRQRRATKLFVGPGQKLVLLAQDLDALFIWRKFRSMDDQAGVNCAAFRNESGRLSSDLILLAEQVAWMRWPGERLYTYVNAKRVRSTNPGYCFLRAGWRRCGVTKYLGLHILEKLPE